MYGADCGNQEGAGLAHQAMTDRVQFKLGRLTIESGYVSHRNGSLINIFIDGETWDEGVSSSMRVSFDKARRIGEALISMADQALKLPALE